MRWAAATGERCSALPTEFSGSRPVKNAVRNRRCTSSQLRARSPIPALGAAIDRDRIIRSHLHGPGR